MFELQEVIFAFAGALVGAVSAIIASKIKTEPDRIASDTERIEVMWNRIDQIETSNTSLRKQVDQLETSNQSLRDQMGHNKIDFGRRLDEERRDCDRRMNEMEHQYNRQIEAMRLDMNDLRRQVGEISEVEMM